MERNCPDVRVKMVIKHKTEWSEFLDAVRGCVYSNCVDVSYLWVLKEIVPLSLHHRGYFDRRHSEVC